MEPFALGRDLDVSEALTLARRATFDPGQFTKRVLYHEDGERETLERWQARAVLVALSAEAEDDRWSSRGAHITDFEQEEIDRLLARPVIPVSESTTERSET